MSNELRFVHNYDSLICACGSHNHAGNAERLPVSHADLQAEAFSPTIKTAHVSTEKCYRIVRECDVLGKSLLQCKLTNSPCSGIAAEIVKGYSKDVEIGGSRALLSDLEILMSNGFLACIAVSPEDLLKVSEGIHSEGYFDSKGLPTIGVGHHLNESTDHEKAAFLNTVHGRQDYDPAVDSEKINRDYQQYRPTPPPNAKIPSEKTLTPAQIDRVLDSDMEKHNKEARKQFSNAVRPKTYNMETYDNKLSEHQRAAVQDATFNMGHLNFPNLKQALQDGDSDRAARELLTGANGNPSDYFKDVGTRALQNAASLRWNVFGTPAEAIPPTPPPEPPATPPLEPIS